MPLVSRTFDQLIDFSRTSAATYVDATGKIVTTPASRNLLIYTQEFDHGSWAKSGATVTANATAAPDGTQTADKLNETAVTGAFIIGQSPTLAASTTYTLSCHMKAAERTFGVLNIYTGAASCWTWYNLSTGVVSTLGSGATATITSVGDGWYRCTLTIAIAASGSPNIAIFTAATNGVLNYAGTAGSGIYIWGAQIEAASTASTYTRNVAGLFPPRFDYDPVTLAPKGFLVEEQRTNLLTYSEQFDNAAWVKTGGSISANATTSPDGTVDADKLVEDTSSGGHNLAQTVSYTNGVSYTISFYAKAAGRSFVAIQPFSNAVYAYFNLSTGAVGTVGGSPTATSIQAVGNGWYRCSITATATGTASLVVYVAAADNTSTFTGDGTSGAFIWGAQVEAGSFATSYIPTVASQVTRTADNARIVAPNFASWFNPAVGSFLVEASSFSPPSGSLLYWAASANDGTTTNAINVLAFNNTWRGSVAVGGVGQADLAQSGSYTANTPAKTSFAYATNDFAVSVNGNTALTDTSGSVPSVNRLDLGNAAGVFYLNGYIRSIRYYPTRLTNAQLQALTA